VGHGKLFCQSQCGETDENCAAQPAPRASCQQDDEESASKDDEVRAGEIGIATSRHDVCSVPVSAAALSAKAQIVKEAKAKALKRRKL